MTVTYNSFQKIKEINILPKLIKVLVLNLTLWLLSFIHIITEWGGEEKEKQFNSCIKWNFLLIIFYILISQSNH